MRWLNLVGVAFLVSAIAMLGITAPVAAEETDQAGSGHSDGSAAGEEFSASDQDPHTVQQSNTGEQGEPEGSGAEPQAQGDELDVPQQTGLLARGLTMMSSMSTASWVEKPNDRISGQDRYETAVAVSKHAYPGTAQTVLIATGRDFPDGLSAAALGAKLQAPLLLTDTKSVPTVTIAEIKRLKPSKIVIIGGSGVVTAAVATQLSKYGAEVSRVSGADRYATSVAIARSGWTKSSEVFIATGTGYADALSAGAAAGQLGIPVVLVPGNASKAPANVVKLLKDLGATKVHIAGGTGAVSTSMANSLKTAGRSVVRYAGEDRYETSALIASGVFKNRHDVYYAQGTGFADALTGAAVAGAKGAPLLLVNKACIPSTVYRAGDKITSGQVYLLGGTGVLANGVLIGNECMVQPKGSTAAEWKGTQQLYTAVNQARYKQGLSAFRVADATYGTPAFTWSRGLGSGVAKINTKLSSQQPWAVYQTVAQTNKSGDKAARLGELILANSEARSWLLKPSGGVRGAFSIGYAVSGSKSNATVIVGTNLK